MNFRVFLESVDEDGFLAKIMETPTDDSAYLIYADWLEEHGNPFADFLRTLVRASQKRNTKINQELRQQSSRLATYLFSYRAANTDYSHVITRYRNATFSYFRDRPKPFYSSERREGGPLYDDSSVFPPQVIPLMVIQLFLSHHPDLQTFFDRHLMPKDLDPSQRLDIIYPNHNIRLPRVDWQQGSVCRLDLGAPDLVFYRGYGAYISNGKGQRAFMPVGNAFLARFGAEDEEVSEELFNKLYIDAIGQYVGSGRPMATHFSGPNTTNIQLGKFELYFSYPDLIAFREHGSPLIITDHTNSQISSSHRGQLETMYGGERYHADAFAARYYAMLGQHFK